MIIMKNRGSSIYVEEIGMQKLRRIMAWLLICMLMFNVSGIDVHAKEQDISQQETLSDEQPTAEEHESGAKNDASEQSDDSESEQSGDSASTNVESGIGYVYLDQKVITVPNEQNIVIALKDETTEIEAASLKYKSLTTGAEFVLQAEAIADNAMLFKTEYTKESISDQYQLISVTYTEKSEEKEIVLKEKEAAVFSVEQSFANEEESEITAYAMDESGELVEESGSSVEDAVSAALEEVGVEPIQAKTYSNSKARTGEREDAVIKELTVALDPGHDNHCGGAQANGLVEQNLTLKVANYCKQELEKYDGVKVIMTRTGMECPNPLPGSYNSAKDIRQRVQKAIEQGADVVVSFHFNSSTSSGANGAEIIYQNESYDAEVGLESNKLAEKVLEQLKELGLKDRGTYSKDSTDGSKDPNGIKDDYFTFHNEAKALGKPAILIEHAFLTGNVDSAKLKNEAYLKSLGVADATGIAKQYGLVKAGQKPQLPQIPTISKAEILQVNEEKGTFQVKISGVTPVDNVSQVLVPVWSEENGQDDLIWYVAKNQGNGIFTVDIDIKNHKDNYGKYYIHIYIKDKEGIQRPIASLTQTLEQISVKVHTKEVDIQKGIFDVIIDNIKVTAGVKEIRVPVWSKADQSDIYWYTAQKQSDGSYKARVDKKNHKNSTGIYTIHVYVTSGSGKTSSMFGGNMNVPQSEMTLKIIDIDNTQRKIKLQIANVGNVGNAKIVSFAVWSDKGGQDDLHWYAAKQNNAGVWETEFDIKNHKTAGKYYVDGYANIVGVGTKYLKTGVFEISQPTIGKTTFTDVDTANGIFDVTVKDVKSISGIESVKISVWCAENQSDLKIYTAVKQVDGTYKARIDKKNHKDATGIYKIYVSATCENGIIVAADGGTKSVEAAKMTFLAKSTDSTEMQYNLKISNVGNAGNVKSVSFAVWSGKGGQDDLHWYAGKQNSAGVWETNIDIKNHKTAGVYYADAYANMSSGGAKYLKTGIFEVSQPTFGEIVFTDVDTSKGIFDVTIKNIQSVSGVASVSVPVWCADNQSDIKWYTAQKQADGTFKVRVDKKNHKNAIGIYKIHIYAVSGNGISFATVGGNKSVETAPMTLQVKATDSTEMQYNAKISNAGNMGSIKGVSFAVWSKSGGQDDLHWYAAKQNGTGVWETTIDIKNHKTAGMYYVDAYANVIGKGTQYLKTATFEVSQPTIGQAEFTDVDLFSGIFDVKLKGIKAVAGITKVTVSAWCASDRNDLNEYDAEKQADGTYKVRIDKKNHKNDIGVYTISAQVTAGNGITYSKVVGTKNIEQGKLSYTAKKINNKENQIQLALANASYLGNITKVRFAVWSEMGNQDDLQWYEATKNDNDVWQTIVDIKNHKTSGKYYADAYGCVDGGKEQLLKSLSFSISEIVLKNNSVSEVNNETGIFEVTVGAVETNSDVSVLKMAVWSLADQSDLTWIDSTKQGNGSYKMVFTPARIGFKSGTYNVKVYAVAENGISTNVTLGSRKIPKTEPHTIMGTSKVTVEKLIALYKTSGAVYPTEALEKGDAATLEEFCKIYIEEAAAENVKVEVAFCQAMLETGWLRFGGIVKIEQFNFCGLGATDINGDVNSAWFKDVRTGIRAQIQHLKAYASEDSLINECVDPRFGYVSRGVSKYIETLGSKDNPSGKGWATKAGYGYEILRVINKIK